MTDAAGNKPDSVTCPSDLDAKVGAQLNCEMKVKNQTFNVNVTVTSVNGSDVKFDMVETVDKNQVASVISDKLTQQVGSKPDSVTCPDNLKGVEGATLRCQLNDSGEKYGISVTVTNVDAGDVNFDFKVDDQRRRSRAPPGRLFAFDVGQRGGQFGALRGRASPRTACRFLTTLAGAPTAIE